MILPEKRTPEANAWARAGSNRFASQLGNTVMIEVCDGSIGSGVFLGYDQEGAHGFVLTAGHVLAKLKDDGAVAWKTPGVSLRFCAPETLGDPVPDVRILARQAFLHPGYQGRAGQAAAERKEAALGDSAKVDLAILSFAVTAWTRRDLASRGYSGARLYDGPATDHRTLLEAHVAGFGMYGTSAGAELEGSGRLLGGSTYVSHCIYGDNLAYHAFSLAPEDLRGKEFSPEGENGENTRRFLQGSWTVAWTTGPEPQRIQFQAHERQVHSAFGDSGGPLFLANRGGLQLAGIAVTGSIGVSVTEDKQPVLLQVSTWLPLQDKARWIHGVMEGIPGTSQVQDLRPKPAADAALRESAALEERKAPAADHRQGEKRKAEAPPTEEAGHALAGESREAGEPALKRRKLAGGAVAVPRQRPMLDLPGPQTIHNATGSPWQIFFLELPWAVRVERLQAGKDPVLLAELPAGPKRRALIPARSRVRLSHAVDLTGKTLAFMLSGPRLFHDIPESAGPFRWVFKADGSRDLEWFLGSAQGWKLGGGVVYQGEELEIQGMFHDKSFGHDRHG